MAAAEAVSRRTFRVHVGSGRGRKSTSKTSTNRPGGPVFLGGDATTRRTGLASDMTVVASLVCERLDERMPIAQFRPLLSEAM